MTMQIDNRTFFATIETILARGETAEFRLRGNSMRPLLRDGRDTVIVAPCDPQRVAPGDVLLCRHRGRHILHRLMRREGDRLLLAGDGNYRVTERCTTADVVGRLDAVRRPSGRIVRCASRGWRLRSRCWTALPALLRRLVLGILRRLGGTGAGSRA